MPVEKILVISTANIDPKTAELLNNGEDFGIDDLFVREYGFIMFPHNVTNAYEAGNNVPDCLRDAAEIAKLENCTMLVFDCDADSDSRLPEYNW